jgi:hypothetical protein
MRANASLELILFANDKRLASQRIEESNDFETVRFTLSPSVWRGHIEGLEIRFKGEPDTGITIDLIQVERGQSQLK